MSDDGDPDATHCEPFHNRAMLCWGEKPHVKTVSIDSQNAFAFGLKSGFSKFSAFCAEVTYSMMLQRTTVPRITLMSFWTTNL